MKIKLSTQLSLAFAALSVTVVLLVSILANVFLAWQFKAYAMTKQEQRVEGLLELLADRHADWNGQWASAGLESIGVKMLNEGLLLKIWQPDGTLLWDARSHNDGMCTAIIESIADTMQSQDSRFQGAYVEETYPVTTGGQTVATVTIGYYGPYFFTPADVEFLNALNRLLLLATLVAVLVSLGLGWLLARRLTLPITRVIGATRQIAAGRLDTQIPETASPVELSDLTTSVNALAATLEAQESLRRQLTSDVAHELRTPLAIVQSHLEAMVDGTWVASTERLSACHDEVARLGGLVRDLEGLTQLEQDNLHLQGTLVDLTAQLGQLATHFQPEFAAKGIELTLDLAPMTLFGDKDKLSQLFVNLLTNALKFTPSGGLVQVTGRSEPADSVTVTVRDNGQGIRPEDLPHVFERFYRADKARTRSAGGSGIGLTIARAIVEAHGGTLSAASEPGQGAVLTVRLPASKLPAG